MAKKLTKKQKQKRRRLTLAVIIGLLIFISGYFLGSRKWQGLEKFWQSLQSKTSQYNPFLGESTKEKFYAKITIFDVGQGSSALYQSGDGSNILIDSGRHDDEDKEIISYLDQTVGIGNTIDLMIFTHNDADHIGHGDLIFDYFQVDQVWMNGLDHTTKTYENLLDAILQNNTTYVEPKAGMNEVVGNFSIDVLHPQEQHLTDDQNEESIVTYIHAGNFSIMTSGDASSDVEDALIALNGSLDSDLMVMGHHGSKMSSGVNWINALSPDLAIYSAGQDNTYDHPHKQTLNRLQRESVPVYGTKDNGNIQIIINEDGTYEVNLERHVE